MPPDAGNDLIEQFGSRDRDWGRSLTLTPLVCRYIRYSEGFCGFPRSLIRYNCRYSAVTDPLHGFGFRLR